jgi:putative endonuclease
MVGDDPFIAVYIMTDRTRGTLYIGVTSNLSRRVSEHREGVLPGFTRKYGLKRLVWHERFERMTSAIQREKSLKRWSRQWKINLIERDNPHWDDLYDALCRRFDDEHRPYEPDPDVLAKIDAATLRERSS